jgi:two-component system response regulator AtoC
MKAKTVNITQNIQRIKTFIDQIADTGLNTVIYGETGVGKELIAECVYQKSNQSSKLFVKVNCVALPNTLFKREVIYEKNNFLFDHNVNIVHAFFRMPWRLQHFQ